MNAQGLLVILALLCIGGVVESASYPRGCFFSVAQNNGTWWFVDPNGKAFISKGVDVLTPYGDTGLDGTNPYKTAVQNQYNSDYNAWGTATANQMTTWGMNTVGAWGNPLMYNRSLAYTVALGFASSWRTASNSPYFFPDVFDAGYATQAKKVAENLAQYVNDQYLMGYFLDNELWWGDDWRAKFSIMSAYLNQTGTAGYTKAVAFLKGRYANIGALNSAWRNPITAPSFENLKAAWPYNTTNANYMKDADDFLYTVALQYFSVAVGAIKEVDPNHLILGSKHISVPSAAVLKAEGLYGDVYSFDSYNIEVPQTEMSKAFTRTEGLPSIIAEFAFRAADAGLPNTKGGGGVRVYPNQTERANAFANYATKAIKSPYLIGLHWFQWVDQPASGRGDGENSNLGLVNKANVPYAALTNKMRSVYPTLDALHGVVPSSFPATCKAKFPCPSGCNGRGCCNTATGTCTCNSDYTGIACEDYIGSFTDVFQSFPLNARWANWTGTTNGPLYLHERVLTVNSNGINFPVSTAGCPSSCSGRGATTAGLKSTSSYGFGRFDFVLKTGSSLLSFTISWQSAGFGSGDGLQIAVNATSRNLVVQRWKDSTGYTWASAKIPFDPSAGFHTYSLVKPETSSASNAYYAIYADSTLLMNITTVVPRVPGSISMVHYIDPLPSNPTTSAQLKSVTFTPSATVVPCSGRCTAAGTATGTGLFGNYYRGSAFNNFHASRLDANVDFNWGAGTPISGMPNDYYSVEWVGQIEPRFTGVYTFTTASDDATQLWIDDSLIINDCCAGHALREASGTINLVGGVKYNIRLQYRELAYDAVVRLFWAHSCLPKTLVPTSALYPSAGTGLRGNYYDTSNLSGAVLTRTDPTINFNWGTGSPLSGIAVDTFSVRWTGKIRTRCQGNHTFYVRSDDGARLWVNTIQVTNQWVNQGATEVSGVINLDQGQLYDIKLEYYDNASDAIISLSWSSSCEDKAIIPQTQLFV